MFVSILKFLLIAIEVLAIFNLLIFVHELGHFLAAKWRGLYVEEFALWFGKPLWKKRIGGIAYAINSIPAGGYVKLPQMAPMEALEGASELPPEALTPVKPLDKIIVAFAGPLFSFLLALAMAVMVWVLGKPEGFDFNSTVIGKVVEGGPGAMAGLKEGDQILEIDGKPVTQFFGGTNSVQWAIMRSEGATIAFKVRRDGEIKTIESGWTKEEAPGWRRPSLRQVMIRPRATPGVGIVVPGSPADRAGIKSGDVVLSVEGTPIFNLDDIDPFVRDHRGGALAVVVERDGQKVPLSLAVPPAKAGDENKPVELGIDWGRISLVHPGPWHQVSEAATSIFRMVGALASSKSDVKVSHFSGPVGIMRLYYQVFEGPDGWRLALALSVLINVNLALLNLLPLPVLDGGHITLALIESVRRKPVNVRVLEIVQTACAVVIIGFMIFVSFFDVTDLFGKKGPKGEAKPAEIHAPPAEK
jgi:regulator of sigma E protease